MMGYVADNVKDESLLNEERRDVRRATSTTCKLGGVLLLLASGAGAVAIISGAVPAVPTQYGAQYGVWWNWWHGWNWCQVWDPVRGDWIWAQTQALCGPRASCCYLPYYHWYNNCRNPNSETAQDVATRLHVPLYAIQGCCHITKEEQESNRGDGAIPHITVFNQSHVFDCI